MTNQRKIVILVDRIHTICGPVSSTICARDCLLQWDVGRLDETITAWERYLLELTNKESHTDENRHGAWVPAIPL